MLTCQTSLPKIFKTLTLWISLFKKPGDFKISKQFGPQALSLLFQSVSSSREVLLVTSDHGGSKEKEEQLSKSTVIRSFVFSTNELLKTSMIESAFKCIRQFIQINLSSHYSAVNFEELKTDSK